VTAPPFSNRIRQRADDAGISLTGLELRRLEQYYALLERWNEKINLTGLSLSGFPDRAVDRLLLEPLAASAMVADSPITWFDLGSGGGSPAIPLKIVRPLVRLTMVESRERKAAFLREVVRTLDLHDADVLQVRFEDIKTDRQADLISVRAVRIDTGLIRVCTHLLGARGRLLLFTASAPSAAPAGFQRTEGIHLPSGAVLSSFVKISESSESR
jgi:16S rRNA (guanine527-N7)-methyltransferase